MNNYLKTTLVLLCLSFQVFGQTSKDIASIEIKEPFVQKQGDLCLQIMNVLITNNMTKITFLYRTSNASITMIPEQPHQYLQIVADDGNVYKGLQSSNQKYRGYVQPGREQWFAVAFEKIPFDVISFDLVEKESGIPGMYHLPKWNFFNVRLKTDAQILAEINDLKRKAEDGDADAAYELGLKYKKGKGVLKDETTALKYLQMSAEKNNSDAKYLVALAMMNETLPAEPNKVFTYLLDAANAGLPDAQYLVSQCYFVGYGTEKNKEIGMDWCTKSAQNGDREAQYVIGSGLYNNEQYKEAFNWIKKSAEQSHRIAQQVLGIMYYFGNGVVKDHEIAAQWFQQSADSGYDWGQFWLARSYDDKGDRDEALEWYNKALANTSDDNLKKYAYSNMGNLYYNGNDLEQAVRYYTLAAELNNNHACYALGEMYQMGDGVLQNPVKAKALFLKSAELGYNKAQYKLGLLCKEKNDLTGAYKWMKQSAENDYAQAQYELGLMYYYAKGVAKNNKLAAIWIEKSFGAGNEDAKKVWNGLQLWKFK